MEKKKFHCFLFFFQTCLVDSDIYIFFVNLCVSAKSLNLSYLSAYLDSQETNYKHGANFATASFTIRLPNRIIPANGGFSPFYLYTQLKRFKSIVQNNRHGDKSTSNPGCIIWLYFKDSDLICMPFSSPINNRISLH